MDIDDIHWRFIYRPVGCQENAVRLVGQCIEANGPNLQSGTATHPSIQAIEQYQVGATCHSDVTTHEDLQQCALY